MKGTETNEIRETSTTRKEEETTWIIKLLKFRMI
jgi:hypothetical protein